MKSQDAEAASESRSNRFAGLGCFIVETYAVPLEYDGVLDGFGTEAKAEIALK